MVMMFGGELCCCLSEFLYYSYCRKSTGREFFVPARTLIAVKLLRPLYWGVKRGSILVWSFFKIVCILKS
jgi:hypothetical protein